MGEKKRRQAAGELPPSDARAVVSRALQLLRAGHRDEARVACEPVLDAALRDAEALHYLGYLAIELGLPERAAAPLQRAIGLEPADPHLRNTLAIALLRAGRPEPAIESLERAIALGPELHEPLGNLGDALQSMGRYAEAAACYRRAMRLAPGIGAYWSAFSAALASAPGGPDPGLRSDLLAAFVHEAVDPRVLLRPALSLMRSTPSFQEMLRLADVAPTPASLEACRAALEDPLLLCVLESTIVADAAVERGLTRVRAALLRCTGEDRSPPLSLGFVVALARQCFATEYAWSVSPEEDAMLARLEKEVAGLAQAAQGREHLIAIYGSYRPLHGLRGIAALAADSPPALQALLRQQVLEPGEEVALQREIRALHPIEDPVSVAVQEQYQDNPFPRWLRVARADRARPLAAIVKELFPHRELGLPAAAPRILIAGCGTGIHPVNTALRVEGASILAVDLSRASLAHALRKTRELGLANVEYAQADILRLGELDRRFDLIECMGVLHHLRNPLAGWRSLMQILAPGGLVRIALYSELGRGRIARGQAFARREGHATTTVDGIRRLRGALFAAADGDPELAAILMIHDIYSISGFRDLLLHVQEHRFTLPQIAAALRELELEFLGFETLGQQAARGYLARFPDDPAMGDLSNWHAFEQSEPDTFAGMYRFWVRRREAAQTKTGAAAPAR